MDLPIHCDPGVQPNLLRLARWGTEVITLFMVGKIKRMHLRDKQSVREIARRTGLSRNTVRTWLRASAEREPRYRRTARAGKLTAFHEVLVDALKADALRSKKERRSGLALYRQIQAAGYAGGYSRVTDFIRDWRQDAGQAVSAFVPLTFAPGEAFQFDWSEEGVVGGEIDYKVQVAHMKLRASRAFGLVAYPGQGHEMLFDAHTRSFAALGGIPRRGIYDNMRTAVDRVPGRGKARVVNARFAAMCAHDLFDPDFCNVASGWEKGRVEKDVQDSRRRIWIGARDPRFGSFEQLNAWLAGRCRELWLELRHPEPPEFTLAERLEHEQTQLMPMPTPFADLPALLQQLRRALLREPGGDRVMAQVLARLNDPPVPERVATALTVTTPPLAGPARYDRLREVDPV